jgi:hypothetical protein
MIQEWDVVALTVDVPEHGLIGGDVGTVVLAHGSEEYEVEFMTLQGETIAVVSLVSDQVRLIGQRDIAHARPMSSVSASVP